MKLDLKKQYDKEKLLLYVEKYIQQGEKVEFKKINTSKISSNLNRYFHLLIAHRAIELGDSFEYVKQIEFKIHCNADTFVYARILKNGNVEQRTKSITEISQSTFSNCIDKYRIWSSMQENGSVYLPDANEEEFLFSISQTYEQQKMYL